MKNIRFVSLFVTMVFACVPRMGQPVAPSGGEATHTSDGDVAAALGAEPASADTSDDTDGSATDNEPSEPIPTWRLSHAGAAYVKSFVWTTKPTLKQVPNEGAFAAIEGEGWELADIRIEVDPKVNEWSLKASDAHDLLGPTIRMKGKPQAKKSYQQAMGDGAGYFQVPDDMPVASVRKFDDTLSSNANFGYAIQIDKLDDETASGRFVVVFDGHRGKMWAAGRFVDARVVRW